MDNELEIMLIMLFFFGRMHPSPLSSYLFVCVLLANRHTQHILFKKTYVQSIALTKLFPEPQSQ